MELNYLKQFSQSLVESASWSGLLRREMFRIFTLRLTVFRTRCKSTRTSVILRRQATQQKMAKQNKQPEVATESKPRHSLPKQASLNRRQGRSLGRFTQA
jgi:hypothetical protein